MRKVSVFHFILMALACYRLSVLIARDSGPFAMFKRAREKVAMLGCVYCVSVWIGAALEAIYLFTVKQDVPIVAACTALALSSSAIMLDRIFSIDHKT